MRIKKLMPWALAVATVTVAPAGSAEAGVHVDNCIKRGILSIARCKEAYGAPSRAIPEDSTALLEYYKSAKARRRANWPTPTPTPPPQRIEVIVEQPTLPYASPYFWIWRDAHDDRPNKFERHRRALGYSLPSDRSPREEHRRKRRSVR